ncbi:uncharacterized protein LOC141674252 [Apium graveolens]|uniref:uncharacterized protein LOC141674252 n=1 Tax=Apium graveolens TaxID=4045 RepID=UPI003D79D61D
MSLIAWNCHGLANPRAVRLLKELNNLYRPSIIFLSETKCKKERVEKIKNKLGFVGYFAVDAQGVGGGLALLWKNEGNIAVANSSQNFIDFEVTHELLGKWRYTGYYGLPERGRRAEAWNMIRYLATASTPPWCIIGDFNDLMTADEKEGGQSHPRNLLSGFSDAITDCGLLDLGYEGEQFNWERFRGTDRWVVERLDKGFANKEWIELFPNAIVQVHEVSTSDHKPLSLQLNRQVYMPKGHRFQFENMWIHEAECRGIIQDCWDEAEDQSLMEKLGKYCLKLEEWGGGLIKHLKSKLALYRKEMQCMRSRRDAYGVTKYNEARWNYLKLLEKQEVKEQNKIRRPKDSDGNWCEAEEDIQNVIVKYFAGIFSANDTNEYLPEWINFKQITGEQSSDLMQQITEQEVKEAVFAMYPEKAPGIDGLNPCFSKLTGT